MVSSFSDDSAIVFFAGESSPLRFSSFQTVYENILKSFQFSVEGNGNGAQEYFCDRRLRSLQIEWGAFLNDRQDMIEPR